MWTNSHKHFVLSIWFIINLFIEFRDISFIINIFVTTSNTNRTTHSKHFYMLEMRFYFSFFSDPVCFRFSHTKRRKFAKPLLSCSQQYQTIQTVYREPLTKLVELKRKLYRWPPKMNRKNPKSIRAMAKILKVMMI